jgi:hypothetical protein
MVADNLYHGLHLNVQKRFSGGLQFLAAYTVSKTLTNDGLAGNGVGAGANNTPHSDLRSKVKSVSAFIDRPQTLNLSWSYELPFGSGKRFLNSSNRVLQHLVGGWMISAMQNYGSGLPVTVSGARAIPTAGPAYVIRNNATPVRTQTSCSGYDPNDPQKNSYLNVGAFTEPAPFAIGNTRVLPDVRHCGYLNEDVSIAKTFPLIERTKLEFGANFFNIFNRHYWLNTGFRGSIATPANFGTYTQASAPRAIQFHLRISF